MGDVLKERCKWMKWETWKKWKGNSEKEKIVEGKDSFMARWEMKRVCLVQSVNWVDTQQ